MVANFFHANYGFFPHRLCVLNICFARTEYFVCVQNIIRVQILFFFRRHIHNNISCVQQGMYPLQTYSWCMRTKYFVCVQMLCGHTRGFAYTMFYMRTKSFVCVQNALYGYNRLCTRPDLGGGGVESYCINTILEISAKINDKMS